MWGARPGSPKGDRLDVLATYEERRFPFDPPDPIIGTRTQVAEVLSRKRGLSVAMIRRLHENLGIPADVLIQPSRRNKAA